MFRVLTLEDYIRIPPSRFGEPLERVAFEVLWNQYVGRVERDVGVYVAIFDVETSRRGVVIFGDGATYNRVRFKALVYTPLVNEVVEGEVVRTEDFGAFVRIGPIDALIHRTQMMEDNVVLYDKQSGAFVGERSRRRLGRGDVVRARVVGVSYVTAGNRDVVRVSLTLRQPMLGKLEWIEEELSGAKKRAQTKAQQKQ
ncbi:DNA-directed RNA polymerase [Vulcanisaeta souniana]|uniref:DNA-directed RNA polymerase subunit Rpo7 n=1 Tax=Vulcanisaeta souniana JCM 11219 TaxID=1293586 RepID=A0A830E0P9_9CREN|nr:DNA-directed RNA polymerase [Vulcanisaeta souniana]BDR92402.1 DNA-directed RNA polymerase [Vulcanisaeta souniana JCM 11219]GGI75309.1 DNA-directed RNA polymerase [Vulcanisaeta souniana JCM 11219]